MRHFLYSILLLPVCLFAKEAAAPEFVVVIPSYNNEKWVSSNLDSIMSQTYPHFSVLYLNDASSDQTGVLVDEYIKKNGYESRIRAIHNSERKGPLHNTYDGVHSLPPNKIVVIVDGDDKLARPDALDLLAAHYKDPNVWVTYGNFRTEPHDWGSCCEKLPSFILKKREFRRYRWVTSHVKSFYARLFQLIKKEDLFWNGRFFPMTADLAYFFPILEMASKKHIRFVPEVLYIYYVASPLNEHHVNAGLQRQIDHYIRHQPPYRALRTLF